MAMSTEQIIEDFQPGPYIPASIIIDRQGKIRHRHVGYLDKADISKYFQSLNND